MHLLHLEKLQDCNTSNLDTVSAELHEEEVHIVTSKNADLLLQHVKIKAALISNSIVSRNMIHFLADLVSLAQFY